MNRLIIGGVAAAVVALGGGAWWMTRGPAPAASSAASATVAPDDATATNATGPAADEATEAPAESASAAPVIGAASPTGKFTLERGVCFGPCPVYLVTVTGDDRLKFEGRKFTARAGVHERDLSDGAFLRLVAIADRYGFDRIDSKWPDDKGVNCPEPPTDMPSVSVAFETQAMKHAVKFYEGCAGYAGADKVVAMVKEFDKALALDDWVGPRERWYGKKP